MEGMKSKRSTPGARIAGEDRHELFVSLLNGAHDRLLAYLASLLGNRQDAEDVFQRASVTMWRRFDTFEKGTNFMAWATTVAFYESRHHRRRKKGLRVHLSDEVLDTLAAERLPDLQHTEVRLLALEQCMGDLDGVDRLLLQTAYGEGQCIRTLARKIGRAPQTLYNRLNQLRRRIAECVERRLARMFPA